MTLEEKHALLVKKSRPFQGSIWLTNAQMNLQDQENPVLVNVPASQFEKESSPWKKQGYTKYTPQRPAPDPTEAKTVKHLKS
jgi:hypothetical protein